MSNSAKLKKIINVCITDPSKLNGCTLESVLSAFKADVYVNLNGVFMVEITTHQFGVIKRMAAGRWFDVFSCEPEISELNAVAFYEININGQRFFSVEIPAVISEMFTE